MGSGFDYDCFTKFGDQKQEREHHPLRQEPQIQSVIAKIRVHEEDCSSTSL